MLQFASVSGRARLICGLGLLVCMIGLNQALAQTLTVLHSFSGTGTEGQRPQCTLTETTPGVFFGTTALGPSRGAGGTIFSVTSTGGFNTLHSFNAATEGSQPEGRLFEALNGALYGNNTLGGSGAQGTIFKSDLAGNVTVLHSFTGANGSQPFSLVPGANAGNLFGTAEGGTLAGIFYRMTLAGAVTMLHNFTDGEGTPTGPVIRASDGNFYGTTTGNTQDVVYKMTPAGALTVLHAFPAASLPADGLMQASNGQLYGVVQIGPNPSGFGLIYRMTLAGAVTTIHTFTNGADGGVPAAGLIQASDGNIYGTTSQGGSLGGGTIFQVTLKDAFSTVHDFAISDGIDPETTSPGLLQGSDGKLYGTTTSGGASNGGTAYSFDLSLPKPLPRITSFNPTSGAVGTLVTITGRNLLGVSAVKFNGTAATSFVGIGTTYVHAVVPTGATTGPISITTPNGTATSTASFTVL